MGGVGRAGGTGGEMGWVRWGVVGLVDSSPEATSPIPSATAAWSSGIVQAQPPLQAPAYISSRGTRLSIGSPWRSLARRCRARPSRWMRASSSKQCRQLPPILISSPPFTHLVHASCACILCMRPYCLTSLAVSAQAGKGNRPKCCGCRAPRFPPFRFS